MGIRQHINRTLAATVAFLRRRNPVYRSIFDRLFAARLEATAQWLINRRRHDLHLGIAEERILPNEDEVARQIADQMMMFLDRTYRDGSVAERAGNTKTYGVVRGRFIVPELPIDLREGVFDEVREYPAWVRFSGPGPEVTDDIVNNGILSIGIKLMGVEGHKLIDHESGTQDFTGISAPTFTTPDIVENLKLQRRIYDGTPALYFLSPFDHHYLDAVMQGLYAKSHASPFEVTYYSCVPYLYGEGRAIQYTVVPRWTGIARVPRNPSPNYLREAMVTALTAGDVVFDFKVQFQMDPHRMPIENASVVWPRSQSPFSTVATLRIEQQTFDSADQLAFARNLSYNPWHSIAAHRPLGNQNRARKHIYVATSQHRQAMNREGHIEPTGDETFD